MNFLIIFCAKYLIVLSVIFFLYFLCKLEKKNLKPILILSSISLPVAYIVAKISGHLYNNPRPFVSEHIHPLIAHAPDNGFPSDHTLLSMTLAAIVFQYNKKLGIFLGCLSLIIGLARVMAYIHHPVDVLAAAIIGILVTSCIAHFLGKKLTTL